MSAAAITFDQIECRADRALAFTLWAKHARSFVACVAGTALLNQIMKALIGSLTPEHVNSLSTNQVVELTKKLQELHGLLNQLLTMRGIERARSAPILGSLIRDLDDHAEDLGDIVEDLVLSERPEFRSLLTECMEDISSYAAGTSARM